MTRNVKHLRHSGPIISGIGLCCVVTIMLIYGGHLQSQSAPLRKRSTSLIGREVSVPMHLQDGQELTVSIESLLAHGELLFKANWTEQEGGGRPLTKGTGRPLSDPSQGLTGSRSFNRISAPDANSCAGCHNTPYGIPGGGGDFVTNVFALGQRFDSVTFDPSDTLA